jgi:hypothetical protein
MRVLAKTKEGFILDAKDDECANLVGFDSTYSMWRGGKSLEIGMTLCVSETFKALIEHRQISGKIRNCQKQLREAADSLDAPVPLLDLLKEKKAEGQAKTS